jgi:hypothetical protein
VTIKTRLDAIGVPPCAVDAPISYGFFESPTPTHSQRFRDSQKSSPPLVSCLMVTRGDVGVMAYSIECFVKQTWPHRELVIITYRDKVELVERLAQSYGLGKAVIKGVDPDISLGEMRNIAVARAHGDILVQWDDDDLSDPLRIAGAVTLLTHTGAAAVMLKRWALWWPQRNLAAISATRACENTIAIWRDRARIYPALARGEDTAAVGYISDEVMVMDSPLSYIYTVTGQNTWDVRHFEQMFRAADYVFEGEEYRDLLLFLSERLPIIPYEAYLRNSWASTSS